MDDKIDYMASIAHDWYRELSERAQLKFRNTSESDLVEYHSTLGRDIRNYFKLWDRKWTIELENGVDVSPNHPDALSMATIRELWKRVQQ